MAGRKKSVVTEEGASPTGPVNPVMEKLKQAISKKLNLKVSVGSYGPRPCVSSGSFVINALIGGEPTNTGDPICFGFPKKGITEIFGNESSGKTTVCLAAVAQILRNGGTVVYLDFEHAVDHVYARAIGVDLASPNLALYAPTSMEDGLMIISGAIKSGIDLVVVDSVAAMVPKDELEKGIDENAKVGAVAKKMAETLPKFATWLDTLCPPGSSGTALVFINQLRATINTGGGGYGGEDANVNTAGGKALKYYFSVRLKLTRIKSEMIERKDVFGKVKNTPYGNVVDCKIVKNKVNGTQGAKGTFFIRYGSGVDDTISVIEVAVASGLVKKAGAAYTFGANNFRGREAFRKYLNANHAEYKILYDQVLKAILASAPKEVDLDEDEDGDDVDGILGDMALGDEDSPDGAPAQELVTEDLSV